LLEAAQKKKRRGVPVSPCRKEKKKREKKRGNMTLMTSSREEDKFLGV